MYHFKEILSFPPNIKTDSNLLCGEKKTQQTKVTNYIRLVDCKECLIILNKTTCCVCGCFVNTKLISDNDFYISCPQHKAQLDQLADKFFKDYPDYTKWKDIDVETRKKYYL